MLRAKNNLRHNILSKAKDSEFSFNLKQNKKREDFLLINSDKSARVFYLNLHFAKFTKNTRWNRHIYFVR